MEFFANIINFDSTGTSLTLSILMLIEYWLLFEKAGVDGWKALIPFYNDFIKFRIAKKEKYFWAFLGVSIGFVFLLIAAMFSAFASAMTIGFDAGAMLGSMFIWLLILIDLGAIIAFEVIVGINLAKEFGKSTAFGVGTFFLEPIFIGIMAFSPDIKYMAKAEPIVEKVEEEIEAEEPAAE